MGHAIFERVRLFGTRSADYIRASGHNGCIATEVTLQATTEAEYMTAPARFADSRIPLAPRAPSIHDPFGLLPRGQEDLAVRAGLPLPSPRGLVGLEDLLRPSRPVNPLRPYLLGVPAGLGDLLLPSHPVVLLLLSRPE